ncbi:MAG: ABC transporter permease [Bacteroidetes bacterium]|nr:ABC transporter permease [Bacteroidota bacterium]
MNKIWLIFKREYLTKVKKRAFIVTTLVVPVLFVAAMIGIALISQSSSEQISFAVKDDSGLFQNKVRGMDTDNLTFVYFDSSNITKDSLLQTYSKMGYSGVLYIPPIDFEAERQLKTINYYTYHTIGLKTKAYLEAELSEVIRSGRIKQLNYDEAIIAQLNQPITIQTTIDGDQSSDGKTEIATAIGYLIGFIIYIYLFAYGAMVMRSVMEEKTNRIVEVIITTIKPFQLMMGKILGIGAVGLTQLIIWAVIFFTTFTLAGFLLGPELMQAQSTMPSAEMTQMDAADMEEKIANALMYLGELNWFRVGLSFLFYFLFGYILYAAQFAAIGSAASDDGDVQTLMFPISIPIIISIVIMMAIIDQPNSSLAFWGSVIPFTAPVVMMSRIPFEIPFWEQLLSMIILLGSALTMVWIAGRIYRIGILIQGQKVSFSKLLKWLRY